MEINSCEKLFNDRVAVSIEDVGYEFDPEIETKVDAFCRVFRMSDRITTKIINQPIEEDNLPKTDRADDEFLLE